MPLEGGFGREALEKAASTGHCPKLENSQGRGRGEGMRYLKSQN